MKVEKVIWRETVLEIWVQEGEKIYQVYTDGKEILCITIKNTIKERTTEEKKRELIRFVQAHQTEIQNMEWDRKPYEEWLKYNERSHEHVKKQNEKKKEKRQEKPKRQYKRSFTEEDEKRILSLLEEGWTIKKLAEDYDCSTYKIFSVKKRYRNVG